jgi:lysophospholipase L1-like esterase
MAITGCLFCSTASGKAETWLPEKGKQGAAMRETRCEIAFFGTSIMEHFQAHSARLDVQSDLPAIGEAVIIDSHRRRGWIHFLFLRLQTAYPHVSFNFDNQGVGGATSRDVLRLVRQQIGSRARGPHVAVLGAGINDVWRRFQQMQEVAVYPDEYRSNYSALIAELSEWAAQVICVSETPFGWDDTLDVAPMNLELARYNEIAAAVAAELDVPVVDLWRPVLVAAQHLGPELSPWSDGAHLSEIGDTIVARQVESALTSRLNLGVRPL